MTMSTVPTFVSTRNQSSQTKLAWHAEFLKLLPKIERQARYHFRHVNFEAQEEAVQEVAASAFLAYGRLVKRNCAERATWSSLAQYAVRQVNAGRRMGASLNCRDVSSRYCQIKKRVASQSLFPWSEEEQTWSEIFVQDRNATPAEVAAFRLDFREFLRRLSRRNRKITLRLAQGHTTPEVAQQFGLSPGRISQLRRELSDAWHQFHGEPAVSKRRPKPPGQSPSQSRSCRGGRGR